MIPHPRQQKIPSIGNLLKGFILLSILTLCFAFIQQALLSNFLFITQIILALPFMVLAGCCLLGLTALAHEAVHYVLTSSRLLNEFFGGVFSAIAFIPLCANRQFHLKHHANTHQPGHDPEETMHGKGFWHAYFIGAVIGLLLQYKIFFFNALFKSREKKYFIRTLKDSLSLLVALAYYLLFLPLIGINPLLSALPTLLIFPAIFSFRALSDHYGIPAVSKKTTAQNDSPATGKVSGWVILTHPVLDWMWSNVHYHEVHHRYPFLSHVYLPEVYESTKEQEPYLVTHGYWRSLWRLMSKDYYDK